MYSGHHWVYLNLAEHSLNSFIPAWAAYRGMLATPNILLAPESRKTHLGLTPHLVRLLRNKDAIALEKEIALENIRRLHYPTKISRLNCIYCWPDEATAKLAQKYWGNQGKHFDEKYLVEIGTHGQAPTIVDTRWIDHFIILSKEPLSLTNIDWMHHYWRGDLYSWKGETDIPNSPLMECLFNGTAMIWGSTSLRMEAFSIVEQFAPESVGILEKGRLGVDLATRFNGGDEWRLGQQVSVLISDKERQSIWVRNILCLDEKLTKIINEKTLQHIKREEINYKALRVFEKDSLRLPDLRPLEFELDWMRSTPELNDSVHSLFKTSFLEHGGQPRN